MKKIPKFRTDNDAAEFSNSHSFADHFKNTTAAKNRFVGKPKRSITIRLHPEDIARVGEIA